MSIRTSLFPASVYGIQVSSPLSGLPFHTNELQVRPLLGHAFVQTWWSSATQCEIKGHFRSAADNDLFSLPGNGLPDVLVSTLKR